jgi:hypothetical protein
LTGVTLKVPSELKKKKITGAMFYGDKKILNQSDNGTGGTRKTRFYTQPSTRYVLKPKFE